MSFKIKNFSMREFNNDVNKSGDLSNKYQNWSKYRNDISGFVRDAAAKKPNVKSLIVFGAGECNDLDLHFLAGMFERIVLTDVDEKSIHEGMIRQELDKSVTAKFEVLQVEYTGLDSVGFFDALSTMAGENAPEKQISSFIKTAFENVMPPNLCKMFADGFNIVLSCPVYTQIVYTQAEVLLKILMQYSTYSTDDLDTLKKSISDSMPFLIQKYNDLLLSMISPGGLLFMLTDIIEILPCDDLLSQITEVLSTEPLSSAELELLVNTYGLKFGMFGREELHRKINAKDSLWSIWPFDKHRAYLVYGVVGSIK